MQTYRRGRDAALPEQHPECKKQHSGLSKWGRGSWAIAPAWRRAGKQGRGRIEAYAGAANEGSHHPGEDQRCATMVLIVGSRIRDAPLEWAADIFSGWAIPCGYFLLLQRRSHCPPPPDHRATALAPPTLDPSSVDFRPCIPRFLDPPPYLLPSLAHIVSMGAALPVLLCVAHLLWCLFFFLFLIYFTHVRPVQTAKETAL